MAILTRSAPTSHWYDEQGNPCHQQKCKSREGYRNTTIADARKIGLFPSVTGVLAVFDKPELDQWKVKQVAMAAIGYEPSEGESVERSVEAIIARAFQQVDDAAKIGSRIHDTLSGYLLHGTKIPKDLKVYCDPVIAYLDQIPREGDWTSEGTIVNKNHGFAGTCDLRCGLPGGDKLVLDFKTRKTNPQYSVSHRDFEPTQIAAYGHTAYGDEARVWGANIYVSTTEPGRVVVAKYSPERIRAEWGLFRLACAIWRYLKDYDPRPDSEIRELPKVAYVELSAAEPQKAPPKKREKHEDLDAIWKDVKAQREDHGRISSWTAVRARIIEAIAAVKHGGTDNPQIIAEASLLVEDWKKKLKKSTK